MIDRQAKAAALLVLDYDAVDYEDVDDLVEEDLTEDNNEKVNESLEDIQVHGRKPRSSRAVLRRVASRGSGGGGYKTSSRLRRSVTTESATSTASGESMPGAFPVRGIGAAAEDEDRCQESRTDTFLSSEASESISSDPLDAASIGAGNRSKYANVNLDPLDASVVKQNQDITA